MITANIDSSVRLEGRSMKYSAVIASMLILLSVPIASAADRMRIAYSSISGAYVGIWMAHDAGLFAKEGLDDQIIFIPPALQLAQATVAGGGDVASLGGGPGMGARLW